jgi:hypothetical protein
MERRTTYLIGVGTAAQRPKNMTNSNSMAKNMAIPLDLNMVLMARGMYQQRKKGFE